MRVDKAALAKESAKSSLSHRRPSPLPPPGANFGFSQCKTKEMVKLALGARCLGLPSAKSTIVLKTSASANFKFLYTKFPRLNKLLIKFDYFQFLFGKTSEGIA
jgi:hypothetical protein